MGFGDESRAARRRKVTYDDYTGGFYTESRVESIQRQCEYRSRLADVVNKSEAARYRLAARQVDAEKHVFLNKTGRASHKYNDSLLDHKAHLNVLERLAKDRECNGQLDDSDLYGMYPPNSLRTDLGDLVDKELKEFLPSAIRKREATRLLLNRNPQRVIDRTKSTSDLYADLKSLKSRASRPSKTTLSTTVDQRLAAKLILPAITVRMTRASDTRRVSDSLTQNRAKLSNADPVLSSVFVTQSLPPI